MSPPPAIELRDGRIYLSRSAYDDYFSGSNSVILLREQKDLLILPVRNQGAGGYLIKIRNVAADRVISGADFFRLQGLEDSTRWQGRYDWCDRSAGLRLYGMFLM
jgi:hypothetical protein